MEIVFFDNGSMIHNLSLGATYSEFNIEAIIRGKAAYTVSDIKIVSVVEEIKGKAEINFSPELKLRHPDVDWVVLEAELTNMQARGWRGSPPPHNSHKEIIIK